LFKRQLRQWCFAARLIWEAMMLTAFLIIGGCCVVYGVWCAFKAMR
jgi:hypothetical protein